MPRKYAGIVVDANEAADEMFGRPMGGVDLTATFGTDFTGFHKTTYQNPPDRALISQAVALYPDPAAARRAFDALATGTAACADGPSGILVGNWTSGEDWLRMRPGDCGRDYRVKSAALIEVTFCGLPETVPEIVMGNILGRVPG